MSFLHAAKILHRDLKSENMLLDTSKRIVKLSDFGFSKVVATRSRTSTVLGTPFYSAPEVLMRKP